MYACDYLARVGFDCLRDGLSAPDVEDSEWDDMSEEEVKAARLADHSRVRELLLGTKPTPRSGNLMGAKWLCWITWPDRVPGLKTWAAQSTLPKIIAAHQRRLAACQPGDLFEARSVYRTGKNEGPSGFDPGTCRDSIDIGFSPSAHGMDIVCRPGIELLAIVGLESLPLVSFGPRECGFIHEDQTWRFRVEPREGGYFYRWGDVEALTSKGAVR